MPSHGYVNHSTMDDHTFKNNFGFHEQVLKELKEKYTKLDRQGGRVNLGKVGHGYNQNMLFRTQNSQISNLKIKDKNEKVRNKINVYHPFP